jgi:hypothetical protein
MRSIITMGTFSVSYRFPFRGLSVEFVGEGSPFGVNSSDSELMQKR